MREYGKYKIELMGSFPMYVIKPISKGSIPKSLSGSYLSEGDAMLAIDLNEEKNKKVRDAKTKPISGV